MSVRHEVMMSWSDVPTELEIRNCSDIKFQHVCLLAPFKSKALLTYQIDCLEPQVTTANLVLQICKPQAGVQLLRITKHLMLPASAPARHSPPQMQQPAYVQNHQQRMVQRRKKSRIRPKLPPRATTFQLWGLAARSPTWRKG